MGNVRDKVPSQASVVSVVPGVGGGGQREQSGTDDKKGMEGGEGLHEWMGGSKQMTGHGGKRNVAVFVRGYDKCLKR
jgi:hypothetical protein